MIEFKSSKIQPKFLEVGKHLVKLLSFIVTNSHVKNPTTGELKTDVPEYEPLDQVCVTFGSPEGIITDRVQFEGFKKWEDLEPTLRAKGKLTANGKTYPIKDINGYACFQEGKQWKRIPDKTKTEQALNRVNQMFAALQLEEESSIEDLKDAVDAGTTLEISVVEKGYSKTGKDEDKKDYKSIGSFKKVNAEVKA
jgi:hypothetical protein